MRDFEIAAIILIAWVLLYHDSYSRASHRHDVTSLEEHWKFSFKILSSIGWDAIHFKDEKYNYEIYQDGRFERHEFKVKHENGNEFTFNKTDRRFRVEDLYGNVMKLELEGYDHVVLRWKGDESNKHYYRIG